MPGELGRLAKVLQDVLSQLVRGPGRRGVLALDDDPDAWLGVLIQTDRGPGQSTVETVVIGPPPSSLGRFGSISSTTRRVSLLGISNALGAGLAQGGTGPRPPRGGRPA